MVKYLHFEEFTQFRKMQLTTCRKYMNVDEDGQGSKVLIVNIILMNTVLG